VISAASRSKTLQKSRREPSESETGRGERYMCTPLRRYPGVSRELFGKCSDANALRDVDGWEAVEGGCRISGEVEDVERRGSVAAGAGRGTCAHEVYHRGGDRVPGDDGGGIVTLDGRGTVDRGVPPVVHGGKAGLQR